MRILAMDLSKRSAGYACWGPGDEKVASGVWELGSEITSQGRTFCRLHERMSDLHAVGAIDAVMWEQPLNLGPHAGITTAETIEVLIGLHAHAHSWGEAIGCRVVRPVPMATWRRHFIGKMPRATKSAELKDMAMSRCRALGFRPLRHDQAEAIGILDYACTSLGIVPYWRLQPFTLSAEKNPFEVSA